MIRRGIFEYVSKNICGIMVVGKLEFVYLKDNKSKEGYNDETTKN